MNTIEQEKMRALERLASSVAHDFNNQLTGITSLATLILERSRDQEIRRYAQKLLTFTDHSSALTNQLLMFARTHALNEKVCNIHEIADDVVNMVGLSVGETVTLIKEFTTMNCFIKGDESLIQHAILNLVLDARGGIAECGTIKLKTSNARAEEIESENCIYLDEATSGEMVKVEIESTGSTVPAGQEHLIFEPFYSSPLTQAGNGMGLALVYGMVRQHHGALEVISEEGIGTTIAIYLPSEHVKPEAPRKTAPAGKPLPKELNILLAEDDELLGELLLEGVNKTGCNGHYVCDGNEAFDYFKEHSTTVDLVILDVQMPGLNGSECLQLMRKIKPELKAILISGNADSDKIFELISKPNTYFMQKPFRMADLFSVMAEIT